MRIEFFKFLKTKKQKKIIYHVGAWSGNFGDSVIKQSIRNCLQKLSADELEFRYINCQKTEFTTDLIHLINAEGNLLIVGGGGLIFYRPQDNSKSGWQWNIDISLIDTFRVPIVVYGIGYNQFAYDPSDFLPITNAHLQKTVQRAALFSVRNSGTRNELIKRGCDGRKIEVIPDSAMFAEAKAIQIPKLDQTKLKIGVNWTTDREDQTFPAPYVENKNKFVETCCDLLNYAIREKNAQIFYLGHMSYEFDKDIIEAFRKKLIAEPIVIDEVLREIYPPSDERAGYLVDVYRQMDIVLGMRGHANILAFGQNTPFIGLGSHRKIRYFLEDIGREVYFFDVRPEGNLYNAHTMRTTLDDIIMNIRRHKSQMSSQYAVQKELFCNFNKRLLCSI